MRYETCVPLFHCLEDEETERARDNEKQMRNGNARNFYECNEFYQCCLSYWKPFKTNIYCSVRMRMCVSLFLSARNRAIAWSKNITLIGRSHKIQTRIWNLNLYQTCTEPFKYKANKSSQRLLLYCRCCCVCVCKFRVWQALCDQPVKAKWAADVFPFIFATL